MPPCAVDAALHECCSVAKHPLGNFVESEPLLRSAGKRRNVQHADDGLGRREDIEEVHAEIVLLDLAKDLNAGQS